MDNNQKLIRNFGEIGHTMRYLSDGKAGQKRILILLLERGTMTQRELTQRLGVQPGTASEVIGKLESAGLIRRVSSDSDRRTTDIQLTESGAEQASMARQAREQRHREMFSCLSDKEKEELLALLETINTDWDKRYREVK